MQQQGKIFPRYNESQPVARYILRHNSPVRQELFRTRKKYRK
jgi:hypothetical protein